MYTPRSTNLKESNSQETRSFRIQGVELKKARAG